MVCFSFSSARILKHFIDNSSYIVSCAAALKVQQGANYADFADQIKIGEPFTT